MLIRTPLEAEVDQRLIQFGVPGAWGLTESIESFDEVQHLAFMPLEDKAWGLLNVHLFLENAIEECGLDVHVMHCPAFRGSMGKQQPDGLKSRNWGEDFIKVNSLALDISLGDEPGLVLGDDPGCVLLGLVDPLEADRPRVQW